MLVFFVDSQLLDFLSFLENPTFCRPKSYKAMVIYLPTPPPPFNSPVAVSLWCTRRCSSSPCFLPFAPMGSFYGPIGSCSFRSGYGRGSSSGAPSSASAYGSLDAMIRRRAIPLPSPTSIIFPTTARASSATESRPRRATLKVPIFRVLKSDG